jgi:nucleoside-diphosphate-sugar epimerase
MNRHGHDGRQAQGLHSDLVVIVTGGSTGTGREVACTLASWGWAVVVVYLDHQRTAEATVEDILAAEGNVVAVRADLADDLDVERLFSESIAAFARVDVVVHTLTGSASVLYEQAALHVRSQGAIVSVAGAELAIPDIARRLGERGISIGRAPPEQMLAFLDRWRQEAFG